jgi:hypothetical protein
LVFKNSYKYRPSALGSLVISALRRQEAHEFESRLGYTVRPWLNKKINSLSIIYAVRSVIEYIADIFSQLENCLLFVYGLFFT